MRPFLSILFLLGGFLGEAAAEEAARAFLAAWMKEQAALQSLEVQFVQERNLAALKRPVESPGRLLWVRDEGFRWELGTPPRRVLLVRGGEALVLRPERGEAERLDLEATDSAQLAPWRLQEWLSTGSVESLEAWLKVAEAERKGDEVTVRLLPREGASGGFRQIELRMRREDRQLLGFAILTVAGSRIDCRFTRVTRNPALDPQDFRPDLSAYDFLENS
ncbi:MAG: outer membrane lipoprotein carrier protein LolA [Verrucomicrobiota bacterium]